MTLNGSMSGTLSGPQTLSGSLSLGGGSVSVDPTLSIEGTAADAKAVGEKKADIIVDKAYGAMAHMPDAKGEMPVNSLEVAITPKQAGSGDPGPTNVRAISGWTGANVYAGGKNLLDPTTRESGYYNQAGSLIADMAYISYDTYLPAGDYVFSTDLANCRINRYFIDDTDYEQNAASRNYQTFTLTQYSRFRITFRNSASTTISTPPNSMIEVGSTATAYEPYAVTTKSISFGQTVYGGTLNVTTGELTVTHGYIESYAGETLPGKWICDRAVYAAGTTPPTGAQVVYKLATPITYQLTPVEVTTLLGENNIWADCGYIEVEYKCDTKRYIQKLTMPTEDDMIANANIASGKYFMVGNNLYYSTASIANGAEIIVGTNCNRVSLADALNNINS